MKLLRLIAICAFSLIAAGTEAAGDTQPFASIFAEYFYSNGYNLLGRHRALAIGSYGHYGYSFNGRSTAQAKQLAVDSCRKSQRAEYGKDAKALTCIIAALDSELLIEAPWVGEKLGVRSSEPDVAFERGFHFRHKGIALKGIVIGLHACEAPWQDYYSVWGEFFIANGFDFHVPDSFSEPRPKALCGTEDRKPLPRERQRDETILLKLRVGQTLRTIGKLRSENPGVPIYIWGHSEGGLVAQFISADVDGIIISGEECGIVGSMIAAPAATRVMFLFGSDDPFIDGFRKPLSEKSVQKCLGLVRNKQSQAVVVDHSGHGTLPWRRNVAKTVLEFLRAPVPESPKARRLDGSYKPPIAANDLGTYKTLKQNKALAVGPGNKIMWVSGWQYAEDAEQFALYSCTKAAGGSIFELAEHVCSVLDVNGKSKLGK